MNDYDRVATVLRHLLRHGREQPSLEDLAGVAGLSVSRFHRLFSRWAGVTPKDFVQCLTAEHATALLRSGASVLDAALDSGLSGPGRLHDLCVSLEAASPGECKSGGRGWTIPAGFAETPFGLALLAESPRGLCHLAFLEPGDEMLAWKELVSAWPGAQVISDDPRAIALAQRIFRREGADPVGAPPETAPLRALVRGTDFQVKVWRALLRIPYGRVTSYGKIAESIGHPAATRATGTAVGKNPLAWIIPCHRVIRESGVIGNYRWGSERKLAMIGWESGQSTEPQGSSRISMSR